MRCIRGISQDAAYNFACEDYFMNHYEEPLFLLWENKNCIMVGKNQNTYQEVNIDYARKHDIKIIRRQSGGGTIYTSEGIVQFSFITKKDDESIEDKMREYAAPLLTFLKSLGIDATFSGRNDVLIDGKKINGNAQAYKGDILLHHGSILFDADLTHVKECLTPSPLKLKSKGVKSVASRMTLIRQHLLEDLTPSEFFHAFFDHVIKTPGYHESTLSKEEQEAITKLKNEKWDTWEWTFGKNPTYNFKNEKKYEGGILQIYATIKNEIIKDIKIYGDFFGKKDPMELSNLIKGQPYQKEIIRKRLDTIQIEDYIHSVTAEELQEVLFDE